MGAGIGSYAHRHVKLTRELEETPAVGRAHYDLSRIRLVSRGWKVQL